MRQMRLTRFTVSPRRCSARIGPRPAAPVRATARTERRFEHGPLGVGQVHAVEYDGDPTDVSRGFRIYETASKRPAFRERQNFLTVLCIICERWSEFPDDGAGEHPGADAIDSESLSTVTPVLPRRPRPFRPNVLSVANE